MRAVAADRRPPPAAWGLAALPILPLAIATLARRYGWFPDVPYLAGMWSMVLLGIAAGMIVAAAVLRGYWLAAYGAVAVPVLSLMGLWSGVASIADAVIGGLILILGLDLWAARVGIVPEWWPRLKLGFTVVVAALLLARRFG